MITAEIIGTIAGILSCTTFLPQVLKTWRARTVAGVSFQTFLIAALSSLLWLTYGIMIERFALIFTNVIVFVFAAAMLLMFVWFKDKKQDPVEPF